MYKVYTYLFNRFYIFWRHMMKFYFEKLVRENFRNGVMRISCLIA